MKCEDFKVAMTASQWKFSHNVLHCRYSLMRHCWETDPEDRPTFSDIVSSLSVSLEGLVGYIDIGAFGVKAEPKPLDLETSEQPKNDETSVKDGSESKVNELQEDPAS